MVPEYDVVEGNHLRDIHTRIVAPRSRSGKPPGGEGPEKQTGDDDAYLEAEVRRLKTRASLWAIWDDADNLTLVSPLYIKKSELSFIVLVYAKAVAAETERGKLQCNLIRRIKLGFACGIKKSTIASKRPAV